MCDCKHISFWHCGHYHLYLVTRCYQALHDVSNRCVGPPNVVQYLTQNSLCTDCEAERNQNLEQ